MKAKKLEQSLIPTVNPHLTTKKGDIIIINRAGNAIYPEPFEVRLVSNWKADDCPADLWLAYCSYDGKLACLGLYPEFDTDAEVLLTPDQVKDFITQSWILPEELPEILDMLNEDVEVLDIPDAKEIIQKRIEWNTEHYKEDEEPEMDPAGGYGLESHI